MESVVDDLLPLDATCTLQDVRERCNAMLLYLNKGKNVVTEVTKAELDALVAANGLNEGLQYKVTDKNWLLTAISDSTLKASTGVLEITNELKPTYIDADSILLDTGFITVDNISVNGQIGFIPVCVYVDFAYADGEDWNVKLEGGTLFQINANIGYKSYLMPIYTAIPMYVGNLTIETSNNMSPGYRAILKFDKTPL